MDMFTPATPETESPEGHEEELAAGETSEQFEQEEQHEEKLDQEQEEVHSDEETMDPELGHSEALLAGKYKSPQDLENAYMELQRQFTKQRMEQKAVPQNQQQPIQQDDGLDFNDPGSIIDAINRDPMGTIAKIAHTTYQQARTVETQEQQFNRGIDEVAQTYGEHMKTEQELDTYFGKVAEVCKELGVSSAKPSPRVLKMAAQELWGDPKAQTNAQIYNQAKAAARTEVEQNRQKKVGLGAPTGAKVQETPKTEADLIRESIVAASRSGGMFG